MKVSFLAFTRKGYALAQKIAASLESDQRGTETSLAASSRIAAELGVQSCGDLSSWTEVQFAASDALVFVGATGIAVRAIAPYLNDKLADPAVLCIDEKGRYAVPLASGHVGGANDLARKIAGAVGGEAVISTATDVNGLFAVDEWAQTQGMVIVERALAKEVSSHLLESEAVGFKSDFGFEGALPAFVGGDAHDLGIHVTLDDSSSPFKRTLHLVPKVATVGIGCRKGASPETVSEAVERALLENAVSKASVHTVASIDVKVEEPALKNLAESNGWKLRFYSADELKAVPGQFKSSKFVEETVGVDNVCERAACADGASLAVAKRAGDGVTVAIAVSEFVPTFSEAASACAQLSVVGLGPGASEDMTGKARKALESCDVIVGYSVYVDLLKAEFPDKPMLTTPMRREVERCEMAFEKALEGKHVAMVCSGDSGVYGMAGLCYELSEKYPDVELQVIPGVSAANGGAAVLGAPLMHDFAVISLSDLLTPWETIERRLEDAAEGDFVTCLYNPSSKKRADYLQRACDIMLRHKAPQTVCGTVKNIGREGEEFHLYTLGELRDCKVDMFTTVFIGNEATKIINGHMVTPRGYLQREGNGK